MKDFRIRKTGNEEIDSAIGDAVTNYLNKQEDESNKGREEHRRVGDKVFMNQEKAEAYCIANNINVDSIRYYVPRYITAEDAAQILGVTRQRISQLVAKGKLSTRRNKGIDINSVLDHRDSRKNGRPFNSFMKRG